MLFSRTLGAGRTLRLHQDSLGFLRLAKTSKGPEGAAEI